MLMRENGDFEHECPTQLCAAVNESPTRRTGRQGADTPDRAVEARQLDTATLLETEWQAKAVEDKV
jgi:hypothetical protein